METELTSLIDVADDDLMVMDVADYVLLPPLLPDADVEELHSTSSFIYKSRKLIEACQANLNRTGRKQGELNKERNVENPNKSREACPSSLD